MADIPPYVFIAVGSVVAVSSWVINQTKSISNLVVFIFTGIAMVIYGISKMPKKKKATQHHPLHHRKPATPPAPQHRHIRFCQTCGSQVHPNARFCHVCGARLL